MFAVKREQRQKMGDPAFYDRLVAFMKRNYIEHLYDLSDDELRMRVKHGVEKGRSYGLTWESSLTIFVSHMLTIHPEFDKQRAIKRALTDASIPGDEKMRALLGLIEDKDWEEAAAGGDPDAYWKKVREALRNGGG